MDDKHVFLPAWCCCLQFVCTVCWNKSVGCPNQFETTTTPSSAAVIEMAHWSGNQKEGDSVQVKQCSRHSIIPRQCCCRQRIFSKISCNRVFSTSWLLLLVYWPSPHTHSMQLLSSMHLQATYWKYLPSLRVKQDETDFCL